MFLVGFVHYTYVIFECILDYSPAKLSPNFPKTQNVNIGISWRDLIIIGKCELYHWIDILDLCDDPGTGDLDTRDKARMETEQSF